MSLWDFFPDAQGQILVSPQSMLRIWPNFELVRDFMVGLITCKNEEDQIENEGARVATRLYTYFSDAQGQIIR